MSTHSLATSHLKEVLEGVEDGDVTNVDMLKTRRGNTGLDGSSELKSAKQA